MEFLEKRVRTLIHQGQKYLRQEALNKALKPLKKAEAQLSMLEPTAKSTQLKFQVLTHLASVYERKAHLTQAVGYLSQANAISPTTSSCLTLSRLYSESNNHSKALEAVLQALQLAQAEANQVRLIISYHNAAVEYELLRNRVEAEHFYRVACEISVQNLGSKHLLTELMKQSLANGQFRRFHGTNIQHIKARDTVIKHKVSKKTPRKSSMTVATPCTLNFSLQRKTKATRQLFPARFFTGERLQPMFRKRGSILSPLSQSKDQSYECSTTRDKESELFKEKIEFLKQRMRVRSAESTSRTPRKVIKFNKLIEVDSKMSAAAVCIQRHYRGHLDRTYIKKLKEKAQFLKLESQTLRTIREIEEMKKTGKKFDVAAIIKDTELLKVQSAVRGFFARNTLRKARAATVIQKNFRCFKCRVLYRDIRHAIIFIQRFYRRYRKTSP